MRIMSMAPQFGYEIKQNPNKKKTSEVCAEFGDYSEALSALKKLWEYTETLEERPFVTMPTYAGDTHNGITRYVTGKDAFGFKLPDGKDIEYAYDVFEKAGIEGRQ